MIARVVAAALILTCAGCAHAPSWPPVSQVSRTLEATLDRYAAELPPGEGTSLRVEAREQDLVWAQARGASVGPASTVRIASITKTYVAAATLRLVDEGRLSRDAAIGPLLPGALADLLRADGYDLARMTVRMLLSHSAGVFDYAEHPGFLARVMNEPGHVWARDEQVAFAMDHGDPLAPPGERFAYSDNGYLLRGALIETGTAQPMPTAVCALLGLDRLGLSHTWFEILEAAPRAVPARARQFIDALDVHAIHPSADLFGGGGLVSTPADLTRFLRALFGDDSLHGATLTAMTTPSIQSVASTGSGYGLGLSTRTIDGSTYYGHGGFWGVMAWHCPAIRFTIAGFVSNTSDHKALAALMEDVVCLVIDLQTDGVASRAYRRPP